MTFGKFKYEHLWRQQILVGQTFWTSTPDKRSRAKFLYFSLSLSLSLSLSHTHTHTHTHTHKHTHFVASSEKLRLISFGLSLEEGVRLRRQFSTFGILKDRSHHQNNLKCKVSFNFHTYSWFHKNFFFVLF